MSFGLSWYGIAVGTLLLLKLFASLRPRSPRVAPVLESGVRPDLSAIITVFNEAPAALERCLRSLLAQSLRPGVVTVVDDCSSDPTAGRLAESMVGDFARVGVRLCVIWFPANRGKRHGLAAGFDAAPDAAAYVCIDSDTVLAEDAVALLWAQFADERVMAATALVLAANRSRNLLTRLIDMRYQCAFLGERVAYSRLGSVLCACGSLAVYRGWMARKYQGDFLGQRFLGRACTFGDDRRLTYYALCEGRSVIEPAAVAWTDVPAKLTTFLTQQARWTRSFIRESLLLALQFRVRRAYWWLNLLELATWCAFTSGLIVALTGIAGHVATWPLLASYVVYVSTAAYIRSVHYLRQAGDVPRWDRNLTFAAAPTYAVMNVALLVPLRLWAILTLARTHWGTRGPGGGSGGGDGATVPMPAVGRHRRVRRLLPGFGAVAVAALAGSGVWAVANQPVGGPAAGPVQPAVHAPSGTASVSLVVVPADSPTVVSSVRSTFVVAPAAVKVAKSSTPSVSTSASPTGAPAAVAVPSVSDSASASVSATSSPSSIASSTGSPSPTAG